MSFEQKKQISTVLQGKCDAKSDESDKKFESKDISASPVNTNHKLSTCSCGNVNESNVAEIVTKIIKKASKKSRTVIKLEIEYHNE